MIGLPVISSIATTTTTPTTQAPETAAALSTKLADFTTAPKIAELQTTKKRKEGLTENQTPQCLQMMNNTVSSNNNTNNSNCGQRQHNISAKDSAVALNLINVAANAAAIDVSNMLHSTCSQQQSMMSTSS